MPGAIKAHTRKRKQRQRQWQTGAPARVGGCSEQRALSCWARQPRAVASHQCESTPLLYWISQRRAVAVRTLGSPSSHSLRTGA